MLARVHCLAVSCFESEKCLNDSFQLYDRESVAKKSPDNTEQFSCYFDVLKFVQDAVYPNTIEGFLKSIFSKSAGF